MGYYVKIMSSDCRIPVENLEKVYEIWCSINHPKYNSHKFGGAWQGGRQTEWNYSWMSSNYDKELKDAKEILSELGFEFETNDAGDVLITGYDSKTGQEGLFFECVSDLLDGKIRWSGEDGDTWSTRYPSTRRVLEIKHLPQLSYKG